MSPETVTGLQHVRPGWPGHAVAAGHGPLPAGGQQVDQPVPARLPPTPHLAKCPHTAAGGHIRRPPTIGIVQLCHQSPLVAGLGHGLDVGVQLGQGLVRLITSLTIQNIVVIS